MRVGMMDYPLSPWVQEMWRVVERGLCEPIDWVPVDEWRVNGSYIEPLEAGVVDTIMSLYAISEQRSRVRYYLEFRTVTIGSPFNRTNH